MRVCVSIHVRVFSCVSLCKCICACVCVSICMLMCKYIYIYIHVRVDESVYTKVRVHAYVCVSICMSVYLMLIFIQSSCDFLCWFPPRTYPAFPRVSLVAVAHVAPAAPVVDVRACRWAPPTGEGGRDREREGGREEIYQSMNGWMRLTGGERGSRLQWTAGRRRRKRDEGRKRGRKEVTLNTMKQNTIHMCGGIYISI